MSKFVYHGWHEDIVNSYYADGYIPVGGETTVYTKHFGIFQPKVDNPSFSFEYKASSEGNVNLKIELEQSNYKPDVDFEYDCNWSVPDDALVFNNSLTDELIHYKAYPPTPTLYGRFKITGLTGNDASTKITNLLILSFS